MPKANPLLEDILATLKTDLCHLLGSNQHRVIEPDEISRTGFLEVAKPGCISRYNEVTELVKRVYGAEGFCISGTNPFYATMADIHHRVYIAEEDNSVAVTILEVN